MLLNNLGQFKIWSDDFATLQRKARRYGLRLTMLPDGNVSARFQDGRGYICRFGLTPADAWLEGDVRYLYIYAVNEYRERKGK